MKYVHFIEKEFVFNLLLKHLPVQVFWKNTKGIYMGCNDAFAQSIDLSSPDDIIGKTDYELSTVGESSDKYRQDDMEVMQTRKPKLHMEEEQQFLNGRKGWLLTSKVPIIDFEDQVIGILGVYVDITDLKVAREKAELSSKKKTEFIRNMSHDLRTPLTGLLTLSEGMQSSLSENDPMREYFSIICDSSRQLHRLFESVLETAQLDYARDLGGSVDFSIDTLMSQIKALFVPTVMKRGLSITLNRQDANVQDELVGHPLMIERILVNLVSNASKFTKQGGITIDYQVLSTQDDKRYSHQLALSICDTGLGIEADKQEIIFEAFTRLSPSYEGIYTGQGLGLYITRQMIEMMGGTIAVHSDGRGKGTTFTCHIPINLSGKRQSIRSLSPPLSKHTLRDIDADITMLAHGKNTKSNQRSEDQNSRYRVLLVEDNAIAIRIGQMNLEKEGCEVTVARTVAKALEYATAYHYDCIFMDVGLPDDYTC